MKRSFLSTFMFIVILGFAKSMFSAEPQKFTPQQKVKAITGSFITLLEKLVEKNALTISHLQRLQDSPELINPMTTTDRDLSSQHLIYFNELKNYVERGKKFIDFARVKTWTAAKITELEKTEDTRKQVHEDTREIHRPIRFFPIPAGKYINEITHEEFEIPEGIEIQETPVTQWQWTQKMGSNPSYFVDAIDSEEAVINGNKIKMRANAPVENVCWNDVQELLKKLNEKNEGYIYALPSIQECQAVRQSCKHNGSFAECRGKRIRDIIGSVWQWTRDMIAFHATQAHLVFGGKQEIKNPKDLLRPLVYDQSRGANIGLRLIRFKQSCEIAIKHYSAQQLVWNPDDTSIDPLWRWDEPTQKLLFKDDGLRWMFEHKNEYSQETQHTLDVLLSKVPEVDSVNDLINRNFLELTNMQLEDVSPLGYLTNLAWLNLPYNHLQNIAPLAYLTQLTELYLDHNQIQDVRPLTHLTKLTSLDLYQNQIRNVSSLAQLTNLTWLNLNANPLQNVNLLPRFLKRLLKH